MEASTSPASAHLSSSSAQPDISIPPSILVLGMAGSGKTSFVQRLTAYLHARKTPPYVINLDPACANVPYPVNIDIRDTVKYKQVLAMIRQRANQYSACLIDTPVSVSSATGEGMDEFMKAVGECVEQYKNEYVPMYSRVLAEKSKLDEQEKQRKSNEISDKMEVLSVHPTLDPPIRERIHLGGVEQENAEDANVLRG
ncbi:hypothetical protein TELCIR_14806 [Teladorsagia circumcincta]|uniref:GPN-loop GTPase n=1 Tax=Teladorsagia circumcincta TaxID=45464 RepID=A0A2G9U256_TELCI|nr:hypothetical protein TELCIR_14806 [Teladorsagia circumcincta]